MLEAAFAVPGDLGAPTGGYAYARKLLALLPEAGVRAHHIGLPGTFPDPSPADLAETARSLSAAPGAALIVDGLAYGALPADLLLGLDRPVVALVHHPLGLESGLAPARRAALVASERAALTLARLVVATSPIIADLLARDFGVARQKLVVAEPGTDPAPRAPGGGDPVRLLALGTISPRKGYDVLVAALGGLRQVPWRLTIVGSLERAPQAAAVLREAIEEGGLADRIALAGALGEETVAALYADADIVVSSSLFEGYGMVLAEAMMRGLPLVASTGGAAAGTMPAAAGLKVPPGDIARLREALRRMITEPDLRRRCAEGSWAAGRSLPRWSETTAKVAAALKEASR